jgi:hypothetical protein
MVRTAPIAHLDRRFSSPGAKASSWADARRRLREADGLQLSTVRPHGAPHVVPPIAVWLDELVASSSPTSGKRRPLGVPSLRDVRPVAGRTVEVRRSLGLGAGLSVHLPVRAEGSMRRWRRCCATETGTV